MGKPRNRKHDPNTWPVCQYSRPRLTQEATKMTNVVFKGGTNNLKYNLGDRCVFWSGAERLTNQWMASIDGVVGDIILHPGPLFKVDVPIPSASRNITAAQGSQMCPSKGIALCHKNTLPPMDCLPVMTGWCRDRRVQIPPQSGTFLKGHPSFRAAHRISWDLSCNLMAGQLHHLSSPAFLTSLQVYLPWASLGKRSGYNSPFQSSFLDSPT